MKYYQAQDTFVAGLENGTDQLVTKGTTYPETHELVQRDLAAGTEDRIALFAPLDSGGDEAPPAKPPRRSRSSSAAKADG